MNYFIRPATPDDINKIIEFTTQEAQESEGSVIDLVAVERGVSSAFSENPRSKYWVMEDSSGTVIANTSVVKNGVISMVMTTGGFKAFISPRSIEGWDWLMSSSNIL